jgi:amino acid adenylation domain-containing protein
MSTITGQFLTAARRSPDAVALCTADGTMTYGALLRRASQVAHALCGRGVQRGATVGVAIPRSEEAVAAVLGVLLSGCAYVPIDPEYPVERQLWIASDCGAPLILSACTADWLPASRRLAVEDVSTREEVPAYTPPEGADEDLLYVLYTSGSTGRPKGVCGTHAATLDRLHWGWQRWPFAPSEVVCHRTSLNFVDAVVEIFSGLLQGVPTAIIRPEEMRDLGRFVSALQQCGVTRLTVVPSLLAALLRSTPELGGTLGRLRLWTSSGEELTPALLRKFRSAHPQATLLNVYGSTEVTADVTCAAFLPNTPVPEDRVPIGHAIAGAELLVLDDQMRPVHDGEHGELYVGGPVVARGYHRRSEEEQHRFLAEPARPGRLFRTGDVVRRRPDGQLDYLGRVDHQVKIRGVRVELEEVERALSAGLNGDGQVAAVVLRRDGGQDGLCAFVAPATVDLDAVRRAASARLPPVLLPLLVTAIDQLPLTPSGKVDRPALAQRVPRRPEAYQPPQTPREVWLAGLWSRALGGEPVGRNDSLVALGADSLTSAEILALLRREAGAPVPLSTVADGTLAEVARRLDASSPARALTLAPRFEVLPAHAVPPDQLAHFVAETFARREPLSVATKLSAEDLLPFVEQVLSRCEGENISFIALERETGVLAGFCLAHDLLRAPKLNSALPASLLPTLRLLGDLGQAYTTLRGEGMAGEVAELAMTGAAMNTEGYQIAEVLEGRTLEAARAHGFVRAVTICTHRVTRQLAEHGGYRRLAARSYDTYVVNGERVFSSIAKEHREAVLFEKDLACPCAIRDGANAKPQAAGGGE